MLKLAEILRIFLDLLLGLLPFGLKLRKSAGNPFGIRKELLILHLCGGSHFLLRQERQLFPHRGNGVGQLLKRIGIWILLCERRKL